MRVTNPASTIADVIRCVRNIFAALPSQRALPPEQRVTVTMGPRPGQYEGAPPRVHFKPDDRGTWGDPPTGLAGKGFVAGATQGCTVFLWAVGSADDFEQYDAADAFADDVWNAIQRAARGRVTGGPFGDFGEVTDEYYGQAYQFRFFYARGVQNNPEIDALSDESIGGPQPANPDKPPGTPASIVEVAFTISPVFPQLG